MATFPRRATVREDGTPVRASVVHRRSSGSRLAPPDGQTTRLADQARRGFHSGIPEPDGGDCMSCPECGEDVRYSRRSTSPSRCEQCGWTDAEEDEIVPVYDYSAAPSGDAQPIADDDPF